MNKRLLILMMLLLLTPAAPLFAQGCAVCTKTASSLDQHSARGLNTGILYLALLPLAILGTVGIAWWRQGKQKA